MVLAASGQGMRKNCASALPDIPTLSLILRRKEICVRPELSLLKAIMTVVLLYGCSDRTEKKFPRSFLPCAFAGCSTFKNQEIKVKRMQSESLKTKENLATHSNLNSAP